MTASVAYFECIAISLIRAKAHMCFTDWCMNIWCIYKVCMSPALKCSLVEGRQFLYGNVLKIHSGIIFTWHCHIWNLLVPLAVILHIGKLHLHLGILAFCCLHKGQEFLTTQCTIPIDIGHLEQFFSMRSCSMVEQSPRANTPSAPRTRRKLSVKMAFLE